MNPDPKNNVQKCAKNTKKNNRRNYDCNIQLEVLLLLLETTMLLEKDHDNCYAFLNQEQAIQQDFTSHPHLIAQLLFQFPKHDDTCSKFRIYGIEFRFLLLQNAERIKERNQYFDPNSICLPDFNRINHLSKGSKTQ